MIKPKKSICFLIPVEESIKRGILKNDKYFESKEIRELRINLYL
jgi:hypothetical protein